MVVVAGKWAPERQITSLPDDHIINLYQASKGFDFEDKRLKHMKIGNRSFTCALSDRSSLDVPVDQDLAKICLEPLRGSCIGDDSHTLCFGNKLVMDEVTFKHTNDTLSSGVIRSHYSSSEGETATVDCMCSNVVLQDGLQSVCSVGTVTPMGRIISYDKVADKYEVFTHESVSWYIPGDQLGCSSFGSFDASRVTSNFERVRDSQLRFESQLCCTEDISFTQRLGLLNGTCLYTSWNEQIVEYCNPNRLRIVRNRLSLTGVTAGQAVTLAEGLIGLPKISGRSIKQNLNGSSCGSVSSTFILESGKSRVGLASGSFNPLFDSVRAILVHDKDNPFGCIDEGKRNKHSQPFIALVMRGNCMFQDKTINAQRAGAVGVVIVNQIDSQSIKLMASINSAQYPDIPAGLAEFRDLSTLMGLLGKTVVITPENANVSLSVGVNLYCDARWEERPWSCSEGDEVRYRENLDVERLAMYHSDGNNGFVNIRLFDPLRGHYSDEYVSVPSGLVRKDSEWSCNGQGAAAISSFELTSSCSSSLQIHSSSLCADRQFRSFPKRQVTIDCQADLPQP